MTDICLPRLLGFQENNIRFRMHSSGIFQSEIGLRIVGLTNAAFRYNRLSQDSPENASGVNILDLEYDPIKHPNLPHRINNLADAINNPVFSQTWFMPIQPFYYPVLASCSLPSLILEFFSLPCRSVLSSWSKMPHVSRYFGQTGKHVPTGSKATYIYDAIYFR